jgi:hypothetical protein
VPSEEHTAEEQLAYAQENWAAFMLATVDYLRSQGLDASRWARHCGRLFAPKWANLRGQDAHTVMHHLASTLQAMGMVVENVRMEAQLAVIKVTGFPMGETYGVDARQAGAVLDTLLPIAESVGLQLRRKTEGDEHELSLTRP